MLKSLLLLKDFLYVKIASFSKESFENSTLLVLDALNDRLPKKLRFPLFCFIWHGLFHIYLTAILFVFGGLYVKEKLQPKWEKTAAIREKLFLWTLVAYHAIASFFLMPISVTEEELIEELDFTKRSESTSSLRTIDMFDEFTEDDFARHEAALLRDLDMTLSMEFALDEDANMTLHE